MGVAECASTITLSPICAYCFTILSTFAGMGLSTNSGAPMQNVPTSSKVTAESLRLEENGIFAVGDSTSLCPKWLYSAIEVWLLSCSAVSIEPIISLRE